MRLGGAPALLWNPSTATLAGAGITVAAEKATPSIGRQGKLENMRVVSTVGAVARASASSVETLCSATG